jgi:hypothetical protein
MDNVFQHSQCDSGLAMIQLHPSSRRCAITVSDHGIGIQRSMALSGNDSKITKEMYADAGTAIDYAVRAGVTSKGRLNQGNGLHGLRRAVEINGGYLRIHSGRGHWALESGQQSFNTELGRPVLEPHAHHGTTVDWQLDCSYPVTITEALGVKARPSELLETIQGENDEYRLTVRELEEHLGSRSGGAEVRTQLQNYLRAGAEYVVLDFTRVTVISSSFADEVMGKLAYEMGELEFRRKFYFDNASPTVRGLIQKAIELRLDTAE